MSHAAEPVSKSDPTSICSSDRQLVAQPEDEPAGLLEPGEGRGWRAEEQTGGAQLGSTKPLI